MSLFGYAKKSVLLAALLFGMVLSLASAADYPDAKSLAGFAEAFSLYRMGNYLAAAAQFDALSQMLGDEPLGQDACLMAARSYFDAKMYDNAYILYERFLNSYPGNPDAAEAAFMKTRILVETGQFSEALSALDAFLKQYPGHGREPSVLFWKAESLYHLGDLHAAYRTFAEMREQFPDAEENNLAAWRMNIISYEIRSNQLLRMKEYEQILARHKEFTDTRKEKEREQKDLRLYLLLDRLRRRNSLPPSRGLPLYVQYAPADGKVDAALLGRLNRLALLLEAKQRVLNLLVARIESYVTEIAP